MATNEDINIKVHSEGGERAIGITPEQTERGIGINNESIVVRSVKSYNDLDDKPQINSVELEGDKTASDLGFADVAMSGSYNDLTDTPEIPAAQVNSDWDADSGVAEILNKPTIPTKTSQLDNDSGFLTSESDPVFSASAAATITSQDITDWNNKSDFSGNYDDLTNKPTIPTKTSQLTNDGSDGTSTYVEADELAAVATSGSYSDLTNKPTIPTKTSDLTNDGADNTSVYVEADELATVATSGDYDDLINKPAAMTVDSALSWASQNPVENQAIRKTIYVKNSSDDREAGINIAFSNPNLNPYVHLGSKTSATKGTNSVGIGNNAEASAVRSVAIGNSATASKREGVALGPNATAGQYSLSIGYYTETVPNYSTAVGPYAKVLTGATNATAIGYQSEASEAETVSVGKSTKKRRIVNVADGTTATDAATVGQIPTKTSDLTNDGADNTSTYVEADELAAVATSGSYNDLTNKPTIPAAQVNSDWNAASGVAQILNKPSLATVATTGSYTDLTNKPTIPTVNDATLTIQRNGTNVQTFTANASSNVTANISVPTKTSDLTNDGSDNTSTYIETDDAQKFAIGQGSTNPVFDEMTPVKTIEWDVTDQTYRPIYQMANTGWTYINMDITVAYRITVTGTNIHSVTDIVDRWHNPVNYPITSMFCRTLGSSGATTGLRYLRAVYPVSAYLNNASYPLGTEIAMYNTTARHVKIEVFKDNSQVTWNTTKPSGPIYVSGTYNNNNVMSAYDTRGWRFRQPAQMYASNAGYAEYISNFEPVNTAASELKNGATALAGGHYAFLADDGLVYDISNTAKNIAMCESKVGFMNSTVAANAAISYTYWRAISRPNATQVGYISHDTFALGNRVFLRCTMDSSGNVHSDNYLSTTMSAGYTWMPFGWARSATTLYVDTRFPMFYTLDANGKLTHINGKEVAGSGAASVAWGDITGKPTFATVATSGSYNDLSNKPTIPTAGTITSGSTGYATGGDVYTAIGNVETILQTLNNGGGAQ